MFRSLRSRLIVILTAVVAGAEVVARLQMAVRSADDGTSEAKPQPTQFLGAFAARGVAEAVAGVGFRDDRMVHAAFKRRKPSRSFTESHCEGRI